MKKLNRIFKSFIASVALICGISLFAITKTSAESFAFDANEYVPISKFSKHQSSQTTDIVFCDIASSGSNSKTLNLYASSTDAANFSYYLSDEANWGASQLTTSYDADGISHTVKSPTAGHEQNAQLYSVVKLSNNMILAMNKGYVSVGASAYAWSPYSGAIDLGWLGKYDDSKDKITAELYVYNATAQTTLSGKSNMVQTFERAEGFHNFSYSASELAGSLNDRIVFSFKSSVQGSLGFYAFTSMKVSEPKITFSTTDVTVPEIVGLDKVPEVWVQERTIPVTFKDTESGLYKIEMQKDGGDWQQIADFSTNLEYITEYNHSFDVNEVGSEFKFRVTDNVGNVNEMTNPFVDEYIDTVAPSAEISLAETFGKKQIDFSADIVPSGLSQDTFTYSLKNSEGTVVATGNVENGNNFVSVDVDGTYTLEVSGVDEAGNTFAWSKETVVKRTKVVLDIVKDYTFNPNGTNLEYSENVSGDYVIDFVYRLADKSATIEKLLNVGKYLVSYEVDAFEFVGEGEIEINIAPKLVEITKIKTEYVYGETFEYTLLDKSDVAANLVVNFKLADDDAVFENVGTYDYEIVAQNTNYELEETKGTAVISPLQISAQVSNNVATYDKTVKELNIVLSYDVEFVCEYKLDGNVVDNPVSAGVYNAYICLKENNPNYMFENIETTLTINKATLYVITNELQTKVYGEADDVLTYAAYGLLTGDEITGELERVSGEDIGYYDITVGSLSAENYEIDFTGSVFEILKRNVLLFAKPSQKIYGETDPALSFNEAIANIADADKAAFLAEGVFVRTAGENVGKYVIAFDENLRNVAPFKNYTMLTASASFVIKKADLEIVAESKSVEYGEVAELSYVATGIAGAEDLNITLAREAGDNVGSYKIMLAGGNFDNYDVTFVSGIYEISAKKIEVVAENVSKYYGDAEALTCLINGEVLSGIVSLSREVGESVGTYAIDSFSVLSSNYEVTSFVAGDLTIEKAKLSVDIYDAEKVYGEADPVVRYDVVGLKNNETISLEFVRESGENVGEYVVSLSESNFENYVVDEVSVAKLNIIKATPNIVLENQTFIYSGNPIEYISSYGFDLEYTFYIAGTETEVPVDAGEYSVVAYFAGDENHNEATSNEAIIVINKKYIPITLKKLTFLYNGLGQVPEYEIGLETSVSVITVYEDVTMPVEVGEYKFSMVSNNPNYYANTTGVLKIVEILYAEDTQNSASITSSSVSAASSSIKILNNTSSSLLKAFNPLFDGRKCEAVYQFSNANVASNGDVFTVRIKAIETENPVEIFAVDVNGNMVKTAYTLVDGYYVFSLNSLSNQIMVTTTNNMMFYARIIAFVSVIVLSIAITKGLNRKRRNNFLKRNTTIKRFSEEELHQNIGIVNDRVELQERVSGDSFALIKDKK